MAKTFHDLSTGGAGASNPSEGGKPTGVDCRSPQEAGYPAQTAASATVSQSDPVKMRMGTMDVSLETDKSSFHITPNRSGSVMFKQPTLGKGGEQM